MDGLSTGGQCLLEHMQVARKLRLAVVVAFQSEGAVQTVLRAAPDVPERNLLHTHTRTHARTHARTHTCRPISNKSLFSYLRTLTTWHCPHWPTARICCSNREIATGPRAANLQQRVYCCGTDTGGQTDGRCTVLQTLLCILCGQCQ